MPPLQPQDSFDSVVKKLQQIYQQQLDNKITLDQMQQEIQKVILDASFMKGSLPIADTGDISITPVVNTKLTSDTSGVMTPIGINYTYQNVFTLPQQYLGFLGFEFYFNPTGTDTMSPGAIFQGQAASPDVYQIIADGTTVWNGPFVPSTYMSLLDFGTAKNALYTAPAWNMVVPNNSIPSAPPAGTYRVLGYMAFDNITHILPQPTGSYWAGEIFLAMSVTNIDSSGNMTGNGMLLTNTAKTQKQILEDLPSGGVVPAFATSSIWPAPWQNPNELGPPWGSTPFLGGGIPAIPGQFCLYTGGFWDGTAIYQSFNPQFIEPNSLFEGITFEAQMPSPYDFATGIEALGYSSGVANGDTGYGAQAWEQLYLKFGNDLGGGATDGPGHGMGATITNAFNNGDWGSVRMPGDMGLTGIPVDAQQVVFNLMWANYIAGGAPSWLYSGGLATIQFPEAKFTYGVTKTYSLNNMRMLFLNTEQVPGGEVGFVGGIYQTIWPLGAPDPNDGGFANGPLPFGQAPYLGGLWSSLVSSLNTSGSIIVNDINPTTGKILACSVNSRGANYQTATGIALPGGASLNIYSVTQSPLDLAISFAAHSGSLTSVGLVNGQGGYGFAIGDVLSIIGGGGKGGTATVTGLQATTPATVTFNAGVAALVNITANTNYGVTGVTIVSGGTGYFVGDTISINQSGFKDATVTVQAVSAGGVITSLSLTTPGTDYVTGNNLKLDPSGVISDVTLVNPGTGYGQGQILEIVQTGGAGALVMVTGVNGNGIMTGLSLIQGGVGYTSVTDPTMAVALPVSGTIATLSLGAVGSGYNTTDGEVVNAGPITAIVLAGGGTGYTVGQIINIPQTIKLQYLKVGYQAFYDAAHTTQLYVQNQASNPNVGRPDQHQQLAAYLAMGQSLYDQPGFNTACANYYFPYTTVELFVNPSPYPEYVPLNTAVLSNTFDPVFIKLSKSTDPQEKWGVNFSYSGILMSPSIFQNTKNYKQWDDVTKFYFLAGTNGYISMGQEGLPPYDIGAPTFDPTYQNRSGPVEITSGPALYSDVTPNTTSHDATALDVYYPQANPVTTRVKVSLKSPNNWSQKQKFDRSANG
jgi:hypothetical protein